MGRIKKTKIWSAKIILPMLLVWQASAAPSGTFIADEGGQFNVAAGTVVQYGAINSFSQKTVGGTVRCSNATFGDPLPGTRKACYVLSTSTVGVKLADEFQNFTVGVSTKIKYGANNVFVEKTVAAGTFACTNGFFGKDPIAGVGKACYSAGAVVVTPTPIPEPEPTPVPPTNGTTTADADPAGIFDGKGGKNLANYQKMANAYGTPAMIPFRFGNSAKFYNPNGIQAPTAYARPLKTWKNPQDSNEVMTYSLGVAKQESGDYSSNEAQVAYVTDPAVSDSAPGVDRISTVWMAHGVFSGTPQIYWNYKGWGQNKMGHPEQYLIRDFMTPKGRAAFDAAGGMPSKPIEVTRAYGATEHAGHSLMVFQNGMITAGGIATAGGNDIYYKPFPSHYVPTAASVTNHGEFALITLWDTQNMKAKLAVLALGGSKPKDTFWNYEFDELFPGFLNYSIWTFVKLLGYIDLPDMVAPTSVEAVGSEMIGNGLGWLPGTRNPGQFPLSNQSNWECYKSNPECVSNRYGFALVASRYEKKVTVVDISPLFQKIRREMFTTFSMFRNNVGGVGMAENQYPQTFSVDSSSVPRVVRTLSFDKQVTAVSASLMRDNLGLIATEDGIVHVYNMDGLQSGGSGANITKQRQFQVGRNITRLTHMKHGACCGDGGEVRYQFIASSRGDNRIDWIDLKQNKVIRTFRDSRIVDLMSAEDNMNHGTASDVITILDFGAKKVRGYRYGPVIFHTDGGSRYDMGEDGKAEFEYNGDYDTPTGAFSLSIENVT